MCKYALKDPYPVPAVGTALVEKSSNETIGIKYRNKDEATVVVVRVNKDSLLRNTQVQVGVEILAINGEAIHTINQASNIILDNTRLEFTVINPDVVQKDAPCCYIEVAPTSKLSPGVSFGSCCHRTMVTVSEIFLTDLRQTRLRVGDIVLAVNGVPVWKPEQADAEQLEAALQSQAVVLYCVSLDQLLDGVVRMAKLKHKETTGGRVYDTSIVKKNAGSYHIRGGKNEVEVTFDYKDMEFVFENDEWKKHLTRYVGTAKNAGCLQTFNSMNDGLDQQLLALKCKVASNAWNQAVNSADSGHGSSLHHHHHASKGSSALQHRPVYVVPSAPTMPLQSPSFIRRMPVATAFPVGEPEAPAAAAAAAADGEIRRIGGAGGGFRTARADPSGIKTPATSIVGTAHGREHVYAHL